MFTLWQNVVNLTACKYCMDLKKKRTMPFQGLRLLMILGVVCLHTYMHPVFGAGEELVSFFFVISGFLYKNRLPWKQFVWHKVKQIYPFYWLVLLMTLMVAMVRGQHVFNGNLIWHILLVQSWIPQDDLTFAFSYVGASWFLSSLLFCYIFASPTYKFITKISKKSALLLLLFAFIMVCSFRIYESTYRFGVWMAYASPYFRFLEYFMGMTLNHLTKGLQYRCLPYKCEFVSILLLFVYCSFITMQICGGATSIIHAGMIAYVYCFNSKVIHLLLGND